MSTLFEKQDTYKNNSLCSFYRQIGGEWVKQSAVKATDRPYLTFSSAEPFAIWSTYGDKSWNGTMYYSTDTETWNEWRWYEGIFSAEHDGKHYIYMRGSGNTEVSRSRAVLDYSWMLDTNVGVSCEGNIENLLDYETVARGEHPPMGEYCFAEMFKRQRLLTPPSLPSTTLSEWCYYKMFADCYFLKSLPQLPAINLPQGCYEQMFYGCDIQLAMSPFGNFTYEYRVPSSGTAVVDGNYNPVSYMFNDGIILNTTYYLNLDALNLGV